MTMPPLPQLIPNIKCLCCDVCCRFPEKNSPLAPYFTAGEVRRAIELGMDPERFSNPSGGRIELIPHPRGDGFICPAFDPDSNGCRIYSDRPLDCQLFPLSVMWDPSGDVVLLGYDRKCPFVAESLFNGSLFEFGKSIASRIETDGTSQSLRDDPELVGQFQEDVLILTPLIRLTEILRGRYSGKETLSTPEGIGLTRLLDDDRALFDSTLKWTRTELSSYSWPPLMIWKEHFQFYWTIIDRQFCLFARYADGLFMPLPPIGETLTSEAVRHCFDRMNSVNAQPSVSRIENISGGQVAFFEAMKLNVRPKEQDYLYDRESLVQLKGDLYKSKRWACNRFERDHRDHAVRLEPYRSSDLGDCLELFSRWKKQQGESEPFPVPGDHRLLMLEDAASAHQVALEGFSSLGLTGRVLRVSGKIVGYTFGFPLRDGVFCILLEVADRKIPGSAAFLFREFCREMSNYSTIHAMDDSGLDRLRDAKLSYHPSKILTSYIATRP